VVQCRRTRDNRKKLKLKLHTGCKEKPFHQEDSEAVAELARRDLAGPGIGGFPDPAGQSPEQPGLTP